MGLVDCSKEDTLLPVLGASHSVGLSLGLVDKRVSWGRSHRTKFPCGFPGSYEGTLLVKVGGENIVYLQHVIMIYNCLILQEMVQRPPCILALDLGNMKGRLSNIIVLYCQPLSGPSLLLRINLLA